jgi:hypothetical protein
LVVAPVSLFTWVSLYSIQHLALRYVLWFLVISDLSISSLILVQVLDSNLLPLCSCCDKQNGSVGSKLWIAKSEKRKSMSSQSKALFCRCLYMFWGIFLSHLHASSGVDPVAYALENLVMGHTPVWGAWPERWKLVFVLYLVFYLCWCMEIPCIDLNSSVHTIDTFSALAASVVIHSPLLDVQPFTF